MDSPQKEGKTMFWLAAIGLLFFAGFATLFKFAFGLLIAESAVLAAVWFAVALCLGVLVGCMMKFGLGEEPPNSRSLRHGA